MCIYTYVIYTYIYIYIYIHNMEYIYILIFIVDDGIVWKTDSVSKVLAQVAKHTPMRIDVNDAHD